MAKVTRSSVLLKLQDLSGMQTGGESLPVQLHSVISPVLNINPSFTTIIRAGNSSATGSTTLYTTPRDKDFYLTYVDFSYSKDVVNDGTGAAINIVSEGATKILAVLGTQTLTAGSYYKNVAFPFPIKVDRNTAITMTGTFTAGSGSKFGTIGGFILE